MHVDAHAGMLYVEAHSVIVHVDAHGMPSWFAARNTFTRVNHFGKLI